MSRKTVDYAGLNRADVRALKDAVTPGGIPFALEKISHVVLKVQDLERSVAFYTEVMGMRVSDAYPDSMMPGRMVFLRYNDDHHGVALVGGAQAGSDGSQLHHFAFEVSSAEELFAARDHLRKHGIAIAFEGRRRAGQQVAIEFSDPDNHQLEICWRMDQVGPNELARPPEQWRTASSLEEAMADPPIG